MSNDVAKVSDTQRKAACKWSVVRDLMGGTAAMRNAGERHLPKEKGESKESYDARLARTTLFNATRKTVKDMTGKVFKRSVILDKDVPAQIAAWAENIDLAGRHINVFARDVFMDGMQTGINYLLADMQKAPQRADGNPATLADEQAAGIRPYLVHIKVENVLGWKTAMVDGVETLTMFRFKECVTEADGEFGEKDVEQIRVLEPGKWRTYRKAAGKNSDDWVLHEEGTTKLKVIPVAPVYMNRTGFFTGEPPLEDLADLNVAHWQSQSDQRNIVHFARVPILFYAGASEADTIVISSGAAVRNSNVNAKLTVVEHSGKAIDAGDKDLANLQFQMQTQGLQLLVSDIAKTATGEVHDNVKENSPLAMMANALSDALEQAFAFMTKLAVLGDNGGSVDVNKDFGVLLSDATLTTLLNAVNSGALSRKSFWQALAGTGTMPGTFDPESEQEIIDSEPPPLGAAGNTMNLDGGGNGNNQGAA